MELLVTGGAGYIGSSTAHQLIEAGHRVVVLDNFYSGQLWAVPKAARLVEGDVGDRTLLKKLFSENRFDGILHFAAHIEVGESVENPAKYYRNNVAASLTLFDEAAAAKIPYLIFSSTAAVYGEVDIAGPIPETAPLRPANPYGMSKMVSERMLADIAGASGLRYVALRYFNAAGARRDLKVGQATPRATHLIKIASEAAVGARPKMAVFGTDYPTKDGTCLRDYIHIEDLAAAHVSALEYLARGGASDVFNVGYGHASSVLEVIDAVKRVSATDFVVEKGPRRPGDTSSLAADNSKIRRVLGWQPRFDDLDLICRTAYEWERRLRSGEKLERS